MGCGCKGKKKEQQVQVTPLTVNNQTQSSQITKEEDKAKLVSEIIKKLNSSKP